MGLGLDRPIFFPSLSRVLDFVYGLIPAKRLAKRKETKYQSPRFWRVVALYYIEPLSLPEFSRTLILYRLFMRTLIWPVIGA